MNILPKLLAASCLVAIQASLLRKGESQKNYGPFDVPPIQIDTATVVAKEKFLLIQLGNGAFPDVPLGADGLSATMKDVVSWIECGENATTGVTAEMKQRLKFENTNSRFEICQSLYSKAVNHLDVFITQPDQSGMSLLDYTVRNFLSTLDSDSNTNANKHAQRLLYTLPEMKDLNKTAYFVWKSGPEWIEKLLIRSRYSEAAKLLNLNLFVPNSLQFFALLVREWENMQYHGLRNLLKLLSAEQLLKMALWLNVNHWQYNQVLVELYWHPVLISNQRTSKIATISNMYRLGQLYNFWRKTENSSGTIFDFVCNWETICKETSLKPLPGPGTNISDKDLTPVKSHLSPETKFFDEFEKKYNSIAQQDYEKLKSAFPTWRELNKCFFPLISSYKAVQASKTEDFEYKKETPFLTFLAENMMFEEITKLVSSLRWNELHDQDKLTLVLLKERQFISPVLVQQLANNQNKDALDIQARLDRDPMFTLALVPHTTISELLQSAQADSLIRILSTSIDANDNKHLDQSILRVLQYDAQLIDHLKGFGLSDHLSMEVIASNLRNNYWPKTKCNIDSVNELLGNYYSTSLNINDLLYQSFTNAGQWPVYFPLDVHNRDLVSAIYHAAYINDTRKSLNGVYHLEAVDISFFQRAVGVGNVESNFDETRLKSICAVKLLPAPNSDNNNAINFTSLETLVKTNANSFLDAKTATAILSALALQSDVSNQEIESSDQETQGLSGCNSQVSDVKETIPDKSNPKDILPEIQCPESLHSVPKTTKTNSSMASTKTVNAESMSVAQQATFTFKQLGFFTLIAISVVLAIAWCIWFYLQKRRGVGQSDDLGGSAIPGDHKA